MAQQFQATPKPYKVLSPLDALMEAAKLNQVALNLPSEDLFRAANIAQIAQSLSTYALAMYAREGWGP